MYKKVVSLLLGVLLTATLLSPVSAYMKYTPKFEHGDVDNNSKVEASDALMALQCAVNKIELDYDQEDAADADYNFSITAGDALLILQAAVGKTELQDEVNAYDEFEATYIEPVGLTEYTLYYLSSSMLTDSVTKNNYEMTRLAVDIQGLINRNNDVHHVAVGLKLDNTDDEYLAFMQEEGATYHDYKVVKVQKLADFIKLFTPFIQKYGIVAWDPDVPSTANVASTICGIEGCLPVQYSTVDGSPYDVLVNTCKAEVKHSLCGMFTGKLGSIIPETTIKSTGSAKCDAYVWAMEKYMDKCNPELLAYTVDGAPAVDGNPVRTQGEAYNASIVGIPNHDYFIMKQMFFFDLSPYSGEPASDETNQVIGADTDTMKMILQKRYDMAGSMYGIVQGFPPWHVKYTKFKEIPASQDATRIEWGFVEVCGCYNCGIEADAANPCWMSNASLYAKYELRYEPQNVLEPDETIEYDPDTYYYTQVYCGDFDCSPWMKARVFDQWKDTSKLGKYPMTFDYSTTHIERFPVGFDYIYSRQTSMEHLVAGEGAAYSNTEALFQGFEGIEFNKAKADYSLYSGPNAYCVRTLPDGDRQYIHYLKPYLESQKIDIYGQVINGFTAMTYKDANLLTYLCPRGVFMQASTAGGHAKINFNGTPMTNIVSSGDAGNGTRVNIRRVSQDHFAALGYFNSGTNYGTPASWCNFMDTFLDYMSVSHPDEKFQLVDIETFYKLLAESGKGDTLTK